MKNAYLENNTNVFSMILSLLNPLLEIIGLILFYGYITKPTSSGSMIDTRIIVYFLFVLIVSSCAINKFGRYLRDEIKYESYLNVNKYPINPFLYYFFYNMGKNILVFVILSVLTLVYMLFIQYNLLALLLFIPAAFVGIILTHLIYFTVISVYFYNRYINIWMFFVIFEFLSGKLVPINFLPPFLTSIFLSFMPFVYTNGAIGKNFSDLDFGKLGVSLAVSTVWIVILFVLGNKLWSAGGFRFQERG
jgi:ABC-2 type transport system permease protein